MKGTYRQTRDQRPVSGLSISLLLAVVLFFFLRLVARMICVAVRTAQLDTLGYGGWCGNGVCRGR